MKSSLLLTALFLFAAPVCAAELNSSSTITDEVPANDVTKPGGGTTQFATAIDDLPLMPGLSVLPNDDVVFAAGRSGRIADTTAQGVVEVNDVYQFYKTSLPPLGWKQVDAKTYRRDQDILHIKAHGDGKITTVEFSLRPNS